MKPIQKILVPFDVSPHAAEALAYAADLARLYAASLRIVYVDQPLTYNLPEGYAVASPEQLAEIAAYFERDVAHARQAALASGAPLVETAVLRGEAASEILNYAKQGAYDLIVMGTHGRTGLPHLLLGSVAEKVLRSAHCPVLTVRAR